MACALGVALFSVGPAAPADAPGEYFQLRGGLPCSLRRFEAGGNARVAFLGGSITAMKGWREMVCDHLRGRYPKAAFDCVDAGLGSTGSTPGAFRLLRDAFGKGQVDLLFVEAAVNDSTNGFGPREQIRGMEGIVRQARILNPRIDVIMLHFVDPSKMEDYRAGRTPEVIANHEKVAANYALPSIELAREVTERIGRGEFTWEKDFVGLHPSPFGHGVYFRSIVRLLDAAQAASAGGSCQERIPPLPLDPKSYARGRLEAFTNVKAGTGWSIVPDWTPAESDRAATRGGFVHVPMLVSETPGAEFEYSFEGTAVGIFVAAGPDAGVVEYRIDGGEWRLYDLFTKWSAALHIPWTYVLDADLDPGRHRLHLRVAQKRNPASKGHAVRIVHMLAN